MKKAIFRIKFQLYIYSNSRGSRRFRTWKNDRGRFEKSFKFEIYDITEFDPKPRQNDKNDDKNEEFSQLTLQS